MEPSLAYLAIEVADGDGVVESLADDLVTLTLEGPARLTGWLRQHCACDRGVVHPP